MPASTLGQKYSHHNTVQTVCILPPTTAANGAPGSVGAGVPNYPSGAYQLDDGCCFTGRDALYSRLLISQTGATGAITGTFVLWGFLSIPNAGAGVWYPMKVNGGAAITPIETNLWVYTEQDVSLGIFERLYLELQAPGGTGTPSFEAWMCTGLAGVE